MEKYCQLSPTLKISRVLTGLWQIADMERDGDQLDPVKTSSHMATYVESGFTTFDMADHYGSAEIISGVFKTNNALGEKAQYLTKWVPKPGKVTKTEVREAVDKARERLQTETIDLLQYHAWNYADPIWLNTLFWLQELQSEGLIKELGVTNFDAAHLRIACSSGIKLVSNQISYSLLDTRAAGEMTTVSKEYGVKILAFGTIAGGFLSERWLNKKDHSTEQLDTWSQMKYRRFIEAAGGWPKYQELLTCLNAIALKHHVSIANVAGRYVLQQPEVGGIIVGARLGQSEHVKDNSRIFDFELDKSDTSEINKQLKSMQVIPGGCGDEYRKPPFLTASGDLSHHLESIPRPYVPITISKNRQKVLTGTVWEDIAGYSRATRLGNRILVSGTTATHESRAIGGNDPKAQAHFVIDKIEGAIQSLGGKLADVVRTRIFISDVNNWEPVSQAHGERFGNIQPANTMVEAHLIGDEYLVEIEAEAVLSDG